MEWEMVRLREIQDIETLDYSLIPSSKLLSCYTQLIDYSFDGY